MATQQYMGMYSQPTSLVVVTAHTKRTFTISSHLVVLVRTGRDEGRGRPNISPIDEIDITITIAIDNRQSTK